MRSEALLRREVSLILSRSSELLKTTDTWTVPTRRATFIFSLWSFYFSYLCFIHERILLENYMCVFWLKHSIRRLVCVSEVMGEINNSCCFQQRMASMLFSSSFFFFYNYFLIFLVIGQTRFVAGKGWLGSGQEQPKKSVAMPPFVT